MEQKTITSETYSIFYQTAQKNKKHIALQNCRMALTFHDILIVIEKISHQIETLYKQNVQKETVRNKTPDSKKYVSFKQEHPPLAESKNTLGKTSSIIKEQTSPFTKNKNPLKKQTNFIEKQTDFIEKYKKNTPKDDHYPEKNILETAKNRVIAVESSNSIIYPIVFLFCLKHGYTYLPLDTRIPKKRLDHIKKETNPFLTIYDISNLPHTPILEYELSLAPRTAVNNITIPQETSYIIYTSGSSGAPKGVLLKEDGLPTHIETLKQYHVASPQDIIGQFSNLGFDACMTEFLLCFSLGCTLYFIPHAVQSNPTSFEKFVTEKGINVLLLPPTFQELLNIENMPTIRSIISAGSKAIPHVCNQWQTYTKYFNAYGPTEATILSAIYPVTTPIDGDIPIGRIPKGYEARIAVKNQKNFSLDNIPPFTVGELLIGGHALAIGYTQEDLTQKAFILIENKRFYRTGDLVCVDNERNLIFKKRANATQKINGYLVNLEDMAQSIAQNFPLQSIVVDSIHHDHMDFLFCAFTSFQSITVKDIKDYLEKSFPHYMIPHTFLQCKSFPLTLNGKIDKEALKKQVQEQNTLAPPHKNESIEKTLIRVFNYILGYDFTHPHYKTKLLQEDSITQLRLVSYFKKYYDVPFTLYDLTSASYVAQTIKNEKGHKTITIPSPYPHQIPLLKYDERNQKGQSDHDICIATILDPLTIDELEHITQAIKSIYAKNTYFSWRYVDKRETFIKKDQKELSIPYISNISYSDTFNHTYLTHLVHPLSALEGRWFYVYSLSYKDKHVFYFLFHHAVFDFENTEYFFYELEQLTQKNT